MIKDDIEHGRVWAKCMAPLRPQCQKPQEVIEACWVNRRLVNRCRWCRGKLRKLTTEELREQLDAQNQLKGGTP